MSVTRDTGGVCAPAGFQAAGVHCGLAKKPDKKDLAMIYSKVPCDAAAMYTKNRVKAAPVIVTMEHLVNQRAQAVLCNSGNANACTDSAMETAQRMAALAGRALNLPEKDIIVASTGVIGQPLPLEKIEAAMPALKEALSFEGSADCAAAIMTTDTVEKEIAVSFEMGARRCKIGGVAKGSGMIHPNMATMLCFLTTDASIEPELLHQALQLVVEDTFNMVSVDGDTSTNDMVTILANGLAGNERVRSDEDPGFAIFCRALLHVCIYLARMMARDGEGATKLLECHVTGAPDDETARVLAKSVICSTLFKSAMFGKDANWGRAICALGYAETPTDWDITKVQISFESRAGWVQVCKDGNAVLFSEEQALKVLEEPEIEISIGLHQGEGDAVAWGCDLTYDYVKINGDYRS